MGKKDRNGIKEWKKLGRNTKRKIISIRQDMVYLAKKNEKNIQVKGEHKNRRSEKTSERPLKSEIFCIFQHIQQGER